MPLLQPSLCACYPLKLPPLPPSLADADEPVKRKWMLESRTGAAVELTRSDIFVHGGLTIPLNLTQINSLQIQKELMLYFAKEKQTGSLFRKLSDWISPEIFFLDLVSRTWKRIDTKVERQNGSVDYDDGQDGSHLHERFFHSMSFSNSCLYIFGGLMVSPQNGYELIASNELWRLDLKTKKWSLVSKNPQISRRFAHSMHTKNENIENRDTKLVIVGGLNNMDQPVHKVDIYNLSKGYWESEPEAEGYKRVESNIDGKSVSHLKESNFSILIENNEAKVLTLVLYGGHNDEFHDRQDVDSKPNIPPLVALPLVADSKGMLMASNDIRVRDSSEFPYSLQFPTGSYFSHTIITAGFHPNCQASSFQCFVYDVPSGKWTKMGTSCDDRDYHRHRFWRAFVWQSHHQTLLLGTKDDDFNLPSVQKFDWLLSFGLPLISISHRLSQSAGHRSTILKPMPSPHNKGIPDVLPGNPEENINESSGNDFRKQSFTSSATSQFESYIRYIAPPVQMTSISSVFPPYAMVLGKDALEIFGKPLSDFEFITEEGDSIGVPIFLLRKRWGRYFDMLLSQGYAKACLDYEANGEPSDMIKFSPYSSQGFGSYPKNPETSSSGSLENYFNSARQQQRKFGVNKFEDTSNTSGTSSISEEPQHDSSHLAAMNHSPPFYENDEEDPMSPQGAYSNFAEYKNASSKSIHRIGTSSTTSSSGGMVFRVPFQDSSTGSLTEGRSAKSHISRDKRRSSSVATSALDHLRPNNSIEQLRRASQPDTTLTNDDSRGAHPSARLSINSNRSSRNPSVASENSSISYVSSSSDRMGNSILPHNSNGSSSGSAVLGVLTVPLPPSTAAPNEPLPAAPYEGSARTGSITDFGLSNKSSPLSSRRPSYDRSYHAPDSRFHSDNFRTSLDSQVLAENTQNESSGENSSQHRTLFAKLNPRSGDGSATSFMKPIKSADGNRLSLGSNADSNTSITSAGFDWEPLLTPRTLYMPWPTATVRAFAEYFYIGQVNGKWSLAPVALNLLIISKIYEIPLLHNLINEVLYSIIGRKEDSLFVTCNSLMETMKKKLRNVLNGDENLVQVHAQRNDIYLELERLKQSLENIDNGFVDLSLLKGVSRSLSFSTAESEDFGQENYGSSECSANSITGPIPTVFAGGPRDSHNSIGSIGYPPGLSFQGSRKSSSVFSPRVKKKSSLSKEVNLESVESNSDDPEKPRNDEQKHRDQIPIPTNINNKNYGTSSLNTSSSSSFTSTCSSMSDGDDQTNVGGSGNNRRDVPEHFNSTIIDARTNKEEEESDHDYNRNLNTDKKEENVENDSNSSLSDVDDLNSDMGLLSLNKMRRKLAGRLDLDESVDPLLKIDPTSQANNCFTKSHSHKHSKNCYSPRDSNLTLESLASPNALPPVDYVIKAIYRTAALVNYPRLMVRCLDCIEISRRLRKIKKRIASEFVSMEQELRRSATEPHAAAGREQRLERPNLEWSSAKGSFQEGSPSSTMSRSGNPKLDSRGGTAQPPQLSPRTSWGKDDDSIKSSASQSKKFLKSKIFGESPTPPASTSAFMNPAFMPPPPSSSKNKKSHSGSTSGFSFFGMRK
ncbi:PMD1 (YER132C) and MDS3 (YGL197W) [Zygosaccharomyces parabailii]|uniref:ZYBA0S06-06502g1_1 n=1 Tax=Zygosaccharomyces bailii (strain CLIB 213 / ATCC 58445 / CBS 680 / BCRC 21525 / NBRC 1098 / NCYC 1416 / NRRL Y-2227) TaxID=1333698 RepID=A0A8J2X9E4_ZYGB2|nr:PMD1 (YER132C) and MDS3 (YGL197W) [Zygosaccharomyces parabailii]CDF90351.1 ZYBA0S06-06502g1_1 [Zygosaccharomyces bailii CLIB 213]